MMGSSSSTRADPEVAEFVANENTAPLVVWSKSYCPYCTKAKRALAAVGAQPVLHELDQMPNGDAIQAELHRLTGQRTVPNVIIGGTSIGGGNETEALLRSGQLEVLLREVGALE